MPAKHTTVRDSTSDSVRVPSPFASRSETVRVVERVVVALTGVALVASAAVAVGVYAATFGSIAVLVTVVAWAALVVAAFAAPFVAVRVVVAALTR